MKNVLISLAASFVSLTLLASTAASAAQPVLQKYKIDPDHTCVVFRISHLGFSHVYGQFQKISGEFAVDQKDPSKSWVHLVIKVASVNTHAEQRDEHLKKPDFFDAKQFPDIIFKSDKIKKIAAGKFNVHGNLTMHGVTKPIEFVLTQNRTGKDPWGNIRTGGDATFTIKRSDFGVNYMLGKNQVGDQVNLMVSFEGIGEKSVTSK